MLYLLHVELGFESVNKNLYKRFSLFHPFTPAHNVNICLCLDGLQHRYKAIRKRNSPAETVGYVYCVGQNNGKLWADFDWAIIGERVRSTCVCIAIRSGYINIISS